MNNSDIRKWTRAATYQKGRNLFLDGKILQFNQYETGEHSVELSADVKGSGRNVYLSEVELDTETDMILDYYCDCPAYDAYPSLCKHCVAVLFQYIEEEKQRKNVLKKQMMLQELQGMKGMQIKTTPAIRTLLQKRVKEQTLPLLQAESFGKIHLEPVLTYSYSTLQLEFKVGAERMYVLKDVLEFEENMREKREFAYGKGLSFLHCEEAFDEQSRPLAAFICWWSGRYRDKNTHSYYGGAYYNGDTHVRNIPLDGIALEQFLLAMGEREFRYTDDEGKRGIWHVTKEPLRRQMTLKGDEKGIEVSISYLSGYKGKEYYIYFINGCVYMDPVKRLEPVLDFLDCMAMIPKRQIYVDAEDAPSFCRDLLPALEKVYECDKSGFDLSLYGVMPPSFEIYLDAPNRDLVLCRGEAVYGEKRFSVFDDTPSNVRDLVMENQVKQLISQYANAFDNRNYSMAIAGDEERLYRLLTEGITAFQKIGKVFVSDAIKKIQVRESPHVTLGVSLAGDTLELSMNTPEMSQNELIEILSRYEKRKKYYRLKSGDFVKMDDSGIAVLQELAKDMGLTAGQMKKATIELPKFRALYLESRSDDSREHGVTITKNKDFRALIRNMKTVEDSDFQVPESFDNILRGYQREGFLWLKTLCSNGFGGILADDMGLGKTLQVICFLLSEFQEADENENRRTLVVAPASLVFNWRSEIEKFAPGLPVKMVVGKASERVQLIQESGERDILLTSYDLLRRDMEAYEKISFFCQVIDEAQYIKNHNTKAARAVKSIRASMRIALTGTPMENQLSELWSIFDYLMPGFLYSYKRFREEIEVPVVQEQNDAVLKKLQKMIRPFVLRRLKKEVLKDLPDKLEEEVYAPLEGEQRSLYQAHVQRIRLMLEQQTDEEFKNSKIEILSELTRLRQLCCDPALVYENYKGNADKTELCLDLVENAVSGGHKILLFSQFTTMLQTLQEKLDERGISFYTLTGNTGKEKRLQLVERFNKDDTSVFCISLKAGGTGLNLTAADVVIHYDPWWNLAVQNQATDRAHRIGQKNVVTVYKLVMKDTIEENILRLQERKKELAETVLGGENIGKASLTREELMEILAIG